MDRLQKSVDLALLWIESASNTSSSYNFPFFSSWVFFFLVSLVRVSLISSTSSTALLSIFPYFLVRVLFGYQITRPIQALVFLVVSDTDNSNPHRARPRLQLTCLESSHQVCDPVAHHSFSNLLSTTSNSSVSETTIPPSNRHQETPFARDHHLASFQHGVSGTKARCPGHDIYCHAGMPACLPHRHHRHGRQFHQRDRCRRTQSPL